MPSDTPVHDWRCTTREHWSREGLGSCEWHRGLIHVVYDARGSTAPFAWHPELGWYRQSNRGGGRSHGRRLSQVDRESAPPGVLADLQRVQRENSRLLDELAGVYRPVLHRRTGVQRAAEEADTREGYERQRNINRAAEHAWARQEREAWDAHWWEANDWNRETDWRDDASGLAAREERNPRGRRDRSRPRHQQRANAADWSDYQGPRSVLRESPDAELQDLLIAQEDQQEQEQHASASNEAPREFVASRSRSRSHPTRGSSEGRFSSSTPGGAGATGDAAGSYESGAEIGESIARDLARNATTSGAAPGLEGGSQPTDEAKEEAVDDASGLVETAPPSQEAERKEETRPGGADLEADFARSPSPEPEAGSSKTSQAAATTETVQEAAGSSGDPEETALSERRTLASRFFGVRAGASSSSSAERADPQPSTGASVEAPADASRLTTAGDTREEELEPAARFFWQQLCLSWPQSSLAVVESPQGLHGPLEAPEEERCDYQKDHRRCFNCGEKGHAQRDCPAPRNQKGKGSSKGGKREGGGHSVGPRSRRR